jgi:hypothetical protein
MIIVALGELHPTLPTVASQSLDMVMLAWVRHDTLLIRDLQYQSFPLLLDEHTPTAETPHSSAVGGDVCGRTAR